MTIDYETHIKEKGYAPSAERGRYQHVWGQVRRAPAETAGKDRYERPRTCRKERGASTDPLRLGKSPACAVNRPTPGTCQSTRSQSPNTLTGSLKRAFSTFWAVAQCPLLTIRQLPNIMSLITSGQSHSTARSNPDSSQYLPPRRDNRRQCWLVSH